MRNIAQIEHFFESMALNAIVEEIMKDDTIAYTLYTTDGSSQSGVGSYVVQSLTINREQFTFPMFGSFCRIEGIIS